MDTPENENEKEIVEEIGEETNDTVELVEQYHEEEKGNMKERIKYKIVENNGKLSNWKLLLLLQKELMKEEQFEEELFW